jgi:DNA polymerase-3 subunit beta
MKFIVNISDLQRTLTKLGGIIPAKSTMPILETLLFELVGDSLMITATDIIISSTMTLDIKGEENGKIAIPAKRLMDTVRSLPDTDAVFLIDTDTSKVRIKTPNGEYALTGEPAINYPQVPAFKGISEFVMDGSVLRRLINRTAFAVSVDELRPAMMGVLLQVNDTELKAVATDGHRLARIIYRSQQSIKLDHNIVVPAKALVILGKAVETGECTISVSDTHVRFLSDHSVLVSRLIEETYPNYESVIPLDNMKSMTISREQIISSVRRVALYASASTHQIRMEIASDSLRISAQDIDFGGEANETLSCSYTADPLEIAFNALYLIDILSHLDAAQIMMKFSNSTRAVIVTSVESSPQEDEIMLIMPFRLNT